MEHAYNLKSPAVKRLMREAKELKEATSEYSAKPLDDNLFEWHFTFRGPADSEFEDGLYHGRIILPPEYPMKPPSIMLLNPNGRFELNKKICLSISGYHPESWQPSWSIRTAILAIIGFMPTKGEGAIGALDYPPEERKVLAKKSQSFSCSSCGPIVALLPAQSSSKNEATVEAEKREKELAKQIMFAKPKKSIENASKSKTNVENSSSETSQEQELPDTSSETDGVRQRVVPSETQPEEPQSNVMTHEVVQQPRTENSSLVVIIVLSIIIGLLLLRRLDRIYNISSNFF